MGRICLCAHYPYGIRGQIVRGNGLRDFAGGKVLQIIAGVGAFVADLDIGSRYGFLNQPMPP